MYIYTKMTANLTSVPPLAQDDFDLPHENRAVNCIVTSVSAIQQLVKSIGIVVLNESTVKSCNGFQLSTCVVGGQMTLFSGEALNQHYTQTVPGFSPFLCIAGLTLQVELIQVAPV